MALPNLREVEWAIAQLEGEESSKGGYLLLSALYIVRAHMCGEDAGATVKAPQPFSGETAGLYGGSDFLHAVAGKDMAAVWGVMDELMETLQAVNHRAYSSVMQKLHSL